MNQEFGLITLEAFGLCSLNEIVGRLKVALETEIGWKLRLKFCKNVYSLQILFSTWDYREVLLRKGMREYFENSSYVGINVKSETEGCMLIQNAVQVFHLPPFDWFLEV